MSSKHDAERVARFFPFHCRRHFFRAKRVAAQAVSTAVSKGTLVRLPCEKCGRKRGIEAHHDDYSMPLTVRWFCRPHHRERDAELVAERAPGYRRLEASFPAVQAEEMAKLCSRGLFLGNPATLPLIRQATIAVIAAMDAEHMTEARLARSLGSSRQFINGTIAAGFRTLKIVAAVADVLGYDASVVLTKREAEKSVAS